MSGRDFRWLCDDGNACTGTETCNPATGCVAGILVVCSDNNVCNGAETCNPATGTCSVGTPLTCDDGNACNGAETCNTATGCVAGTPVVCNDNNVCNGLETSSRQPGRVNRGRHSSVAMGTPATAPKPAVPRSGVSRIPRAIATVRRRRQVQRSRVPQSARRKLRQPGTPPLCNDGNACNGVENLVAATGCVPGTPLVCTDGDACNGLESCNASTGCVADIPPTCNDGNELQWRGELCDGDGLRTRDGTHLQRQRCL